MTHSTILFRPYPSGMHNEFGDRHIIELQGQMRQIAHRKAGSLKTHHYLRLMLPVL